MKKSIFYKLFPVLFILCGGIYLFYSPSTVKKENLQQISGTLANPPEAHDNGEGEYWVTFKFNNKNIEFNIEGCAYKSLSKNKFLLLKKGDYLEILVRKKRSFREIISSEHDCFDIRVSNPNIYLSLQDTNNCHENSWKMIITLGMILLIVILFKELIDIYNK